MLLDDLIPAKYYLTDPIFKHHNIRDLTDSSTYVGIAPRRAVFLPLLQPIGDNPSDPNDLV